MDNNHSCGGMAQPTWLWHTRDHLENYSIKKKRSKAVTNHFRDKYDIPKKSKNLLVCSESRKKLGWN